jgi:hypothetical protein
VPTPTLDDDLGLVQRVEELAIKKLVAQARIEALDGAVLPRTARVDVGGLCANGGAKVNVASRTMTTPLHMRRRIGSNRGMNSFLKDPSVAAELAFEKGRVLGLLHLLKELRPLIAASHDHRAPELLKRIDAVLTATDARR